VAVERTDEWFRAGAIDVALPDATGVATVQNIKLPWKTLGKSIEKLVEDSLPQIHGSMDQSTHT